MSYYYSRDFGISLVIPKRYLVLLARLLAEKTLRITLATTINGYNVLATVLSVIHVLTYLNLFRILSLTKFMHFANEDTKAQSS